MSRRRGAWRDLAVELSLMKAIERRPSKRFFFERPDVGERAVLALFGDSEFEHEEFRALAVAAGARLVGERSFRGHDPRPSHYLGTGNLERLKESIKETDAELVLFDVELNAAQERNLEKTLGCGVVDRTRLILDIFAARALSHEGKLQVEAAQLEHLSTRLVRGWTHLERQRGGIGMRGPGETQLESDRRAVARRLRSVRTQLAKLRRVRALRRRHRRRLKLPIVAMVGRTNAGKSTLFNHLTSSGVEVADRLFTTLDTSMRRVSLSRGEALLVDTVGFIRKLPHTLVEAFMATLEEVVEADLLLHVTDASGEDPLADVGEVERVLGELEALARPRIMVYSKIDRLADAMACPGREHSNGAQATVNVSAATGVGCEALLTAVGEALWGEMRERVVTIPVADGALRARLHRNAEVLSEISDDKNLHLRLRSPARRWPALERYILAARGIS